METRVSISPNSFHGELDTSKDSVIVGFWGFSLLLPQKMIRLVFTHNKEVIQFTIDNRIVKYHDRLWKNSVQFVPKDTEFVKKIIMSRNKIPHMVIDWINSANSGDNLKEYESCVDDSAIADVVTKDALLKGLKLQKRFEDGNDV